MMQRQSENSFVLTCMFLGFLFSLGLPPFHHWYLSIISLSILFRFYINSANPKSVFMTMFVFSLSYFTVSSYWIVNTFLVVVIDLFLGYLSGVIALLVVASFMALVTALCVSFSVLVGNKLKIKYISILLVPLAWSVSEYIRSVMLGGQPMHYVGYMVGNNDYLIQLASLKNVYVVSYFIVLISMLLSFEYRYLGLGACTFFAVFIFGIYRVDYMADDRNSSVKEIKVRLVNANLSQSQLLKDQNTYRVVNDYIELSKGIPGEKFTPELIIWPESVLQFYADKGPDSKRNRDYVTDFMSQGQTLITGAPRYEYGHDSKPRFYSSMIQLGYMGKLLGTYDKHRLVPWGEFIPYRESIPEEIANIFDVKDYTPGVGPLSLKYKDNIEILPLLCAEGHFPQMLGEYQEKQDIIVMIGNEAWLEGTTEPSQYFVNARYRAVESGLPVLLASNKGYLAIINKKGIVEKSMYQNKPSVLDGVLRVEIN